MNRLPVAVLAGGLATRLGPLTRETPKCLLEVAGRPVHPPPAPPAPRARGCAGSSSAWATSARGSWRPSATARRSAWRSTIPSTARNCGGRPGRSSGPCPLLGPAFFVLYGDSYLECDYAAVQEAFEAAGKLALMTVFRNEGSGTPATSSSATAASWPTTRRPAPRPCSTSTTVWASWIGGPSRCVPESGPCDLAAVYQEMLRRGELAGFEVTERFYEIGSVAGSRRRGNTWPGETELKGRRAPGGDRCHTRHSSCPRPSR